MKRILLPAALAFAGTLAFAQTPGIRQSPDTSQQAATAAPSASAQLRQRHAHDPHKAALHMSKELNLTPDQTAKIEPILADRQQKVSALMANTALDPQSRKTQMRAIHEASEQQLAGVLTPDQLQQLKSMHRGHHGHGQPPPTPPAA